LRSWASSAHGADVVSVGEMHRRSESGIAAKDIVFARRRQDPEEMAAALDAGHPINST